MKRKVFISIFFMCVQFLLINTRGYAVPIILEYDSPIGMTIETQEIVLLDSGDKTGVDKSFQAPKDGKLTVWYTIGGVRKHPTPGKSARIINENVKELYKYKWKEFGAQDREIAFNPTASKTTTQREAFFSSGIMQDWDDFWNTKPVGFSSVWPFIIDVEDSVDLFVGVDLTIWHNAPVAFTFGNIIQINNGQSPLLPGFTIGETDIGYVEGAGWLNSAPFTGHVQLGASDGSTTIPEPTTFALISLGIIGIAFCRRRKLR